MAGTRNRLQADSEEGTSVTTPPKNQTTSPQPTFDEVGTRRVNEPSTSWACPNCTEQLDYVHDFFAKEGVCYEMFRCPHCWLYLAVPIS